MLFCEQLHTQAFRGIRQLGDQRILEYRKRDGVRLRNLCSEEYAPLPSPPLASLSDLGWRKFLVGSLVMFRRELNVNGTQHCKYERLQ
jgi:hypothetical protein